MYRKIILHLSLCLLGAVIVSFILYYLRPQQINERLMGFERLEWGGEIRLADSLVFPAHRYYFAGTRGDSILLANVRQPMRLWLFPGSFRDSIQMQLSVGKFAFRNLSIRTDGNDLYLLDGNQPFIYRGRTDSWSVKPWLDSTFFVLAVPVSASSAVVMSRVNSLAMLGKLSRTGIAKQWFPGLLEKQVDGYFCSFGHLLADREQHRVIYLYRFRNQFLVTDTNMQLLYKAHTIDTISRAMIKTGKQGEATFSMAAPPLTVNLNSCVRNGKLFVHSNMKAANETGKKFTNHSPVDVYDLSRGNYLYSLYIPNRFGHKLQDFSLLANGDLVAIYRDELVRFTFRETTGEIR